MCDPAKPARRLDGSEVSGKQVRMPIQPASSGHGNLKPNDKGKYTKHDFDGLKNAVPIAENKFQKSLNFSLPQPSNPGVPSTNPDPSASHQKVPKPSKNFNRHQKTLPELPLILNRLLADVPFTHQGVLGGRTASDVVNLSYDRFEFVGDAYIELIATRLIFPRFPDLPAGRLSQKRESLVKNETLAEFSLAYGFDKRVNLPKSYFQGQEQNKLWTKTMGDVFEAYVAAVILSDPVNGFAVAEAWLTELWEPKLCMSDNIATWDSNAKVQLASRIMGKGIKIQYRDEAQPNVIRKEGKVVFQVGAYLTGWGWEDVHLGSGTGLNKNEAGSKAATQALANPLTEKIEAVKREFDVKRTAERNNQNDTTVSPGV